MLESLTNARLVISLLARGNCHWQAVSRRRQRTSCIRVICAGRIVCLVEINLDFAVLGWISIKKPRGLVGLCLAGKVAKYDEQIALVVGFFRVQSIFLPVDREGHVSRN